MLAYGHTVLSYARGFVFVHPKGIPTSAVSDRAATVQMYRFIPPRSISTRWPNVGWCGTLDPPDITDCSMMPLQHAKGVPD